MVGAIPIGRYRMCAVLVDESERTMKNPADQVAYPLCAEPWSASGCKDCRRNTALFPDSWSPYQPVHPRPRKMQDGTVVCDHHYVIPRKAT